MKNIHLLLLVGILFHSEVSAQAYLASTGKGKSIQGSAAIRLPFNTDQVEMALKAYLSQKGYPSSNTRGYIRSRGVTLGDPADETSDLYFSTSTPDRKVKDMTLLTLVPAKKNQEVTSGSFVDSSRLDAARVFLDSLAPFVNAHAIGMQISGQQDVLRKAQKKMDGMRNDSTDYEKRLRSLRSGLAQNKADQAKASNDLQTYIGADIDTKNKYQKRLNKLMDRQGSLEKKIRSTESDLTDKKADMVKQQATINQQLQALVASKERNN